MEVLCRPKRNSLSVSRSRNKLLAKGDTDLSCLQLSSGSFLPSAPAVTLLVPLPTADGDNGQSSHPETVHAGTWTTGQVKLCVTISLRKETDTKKLSAGGRQDQDPVRGPRVHGCHPSQDGGFVGSEPILSKISHCFLSFVSVQTPTKPSPLHLRGSAHPLQTGNRSPAWLLGASEDNGGRGRVWSQAGVLPVLGAQKKAAHPLKSATGSTCTLRKGC